MTLRSILIIADDLTGAADSAAQFRQVGLSAVVLAPPARCRFIWPRAQVVSLSLNTRDASPVAVRHIWERQAPAIRCLGAGRLGLPQNRFNIAWPPGARSPPPARLPWRGKRDRRPSLSETRPTYD